MSAFVLKLIALFSMLLDHVLKVLPVQNILTGVFGMSLEGSYLLLEIVTPLGRLAFPIFAFFIAEGCRHTHSPGRYVGRLLLFGVISEIPFRLALLRMPVSGALSLWPPRLSNVFFTLAFGALACFACQALKKQGYGALAVLPALALALLAEFLHTDYGAAGVLAIFLAYALPEKLPRLLGLAGIFSVLYLLWAPWNGIELRLFSSPSYLLNWAAAMLALTLLYFYNGRRGKPLKWTFYIFYPAHLSLLAAYSVPYILPNIQSHF